MTRLFLLLFIALVAAHEHLDDHFCSRPDLDRHKVYVYSSVGQVPVKVQRCAYADSKTAYSDISNSCLRAFQSGILDDKWHKQDKVGIKGSPVVLEEYICHADIARNEIYLKSGTVCRYDRGFCYDPKESLNYAVVWDLLEKPKSRCSDQLHTVFEGEIDVWFFKEQNLHYLFYYNDKVDEAFYLTYVEQSKCQGCDVWYTEEGYMVSTKPLNATPCDSKYFSFRPKRVVSEAILKNCDLRSLPLDHFKEGIDVDYLSDEHNVYLLFRKYEELIKESQEHILEIIHNETLTVSNKASADVKSECSHLYELLEKTKKDVESIEHKLSEAKSGHSVDDEKLVEQIESLKKKNEEIDEVLKRLVETNHHLEEQLIGNNEALQKLIEKVDVLYKIVKVDMADFISKTEVCERIANLEQKFDQQIKELAANVTQILVEYEHKLTRVNTGVKGGVKGGVRGGTNAAASENKHELEMLLIEKLKSLNEDQCHALIDASKEKTELLIEQLRNEAFVNSSALEELLLKKILEVSHLHEPLGKQLAEIENKIKDLYHDIEAINKNAADLKEEYGKSVADLQQQIHKIEESVLHFEKELVLIREEIKNNVPEKPDFTPYVENLKKWVQDLLKPRDARLDSLELITVHLSDGLKNETEEVSLLRQEVQKIIEELKSLDSSRAIAKTDLNNELEVVKNNITKIYQVVEENSALHTKQTTEIQNQRNAQQNEWDKVIENLKSLIDQVKASVTSNTDKISQLEAADVKFTGGLENVQTELTNEGKKVNELNELTNKRQTDFEAWKVQVDEDIECLKDNVTTLFDLLKKQSDTIGELQKEKEKTSFEDSDLVEITDVNHGGYGGPHGGYLKTKNPTKGGTQRLVASENLQDVVDKQAVHIENLKNDLVMASKIINDHADRLETLESAVENLLLRVTKAENKLVTECKRLDSAIYSTNGEIDRIESEVKTKVSQCCGGTKTHGSYGIKH